MHDYERIKRQIQAESDIHKRFGPEKIWSFVLNSIFNKNTQEAISFMLSPVGGYDESELNQIIFKAKTHKRLYYDRINC